MMLCMWLSSNYVNKNSLVVLHEKKHDVQKGKMRPFSHTFSLEKFTSACRVGGYE